MKLIVPPVQSPLGFPAPCTVLRFGCTLKHSGAHTSSPLQYCVNGSFNIRTRQGGCEQVGHCVLVYGDACRTKKLGVITLRVERLECAYLRALALDSSFLSF
eukprot:476531-Prymnesium_polylepis.1